MGLFSALTNSVKSFSKSCRDELKSKSPKFNKALKSFGIDFSKVGDVSYKIMEFFGKEMKECLNDKNGYFLKLRSNIHTVAQDVNSNVIYGMNYDEYQQEKENRKKNNGQSQNSEVPSNDLEM